MPPDAASSTSALRSLLGGGGRYRNLVRALMVGLRAREVGVLAHEFRRRLFSERLHFGLMRDLEVPFDPPQAKIPIEIRPLRRDDLPKLLDLDAEAMSDRGPYVRMHRLNFANRGIGTCYVGATDDDEPCYMQWLIPAAQNAEVKDYFHGIFPWLDADEALLEYAFTPESYQRMGIMAAAMAQIAERASDFGARRVITFVDAENVAALKGCRKAGFAPHLVRRDRWRLFVRRVTFEPLEPELVGVPE
jgi:RimJ/RimL family protein N-acetyltransferase